MTHRTISWTTPYTFSGKEKDVETGYGYFGARYYDSGLSIWLSVDQMSDKYPSMSPYNYCANNPVILVDPDGKEWIAYNKEGTVIATGGDEKDNRRFVVMSDKDAEQVTDKKGVKIEDVKSAVQIPDNKTINDILQYFIDSDNGNNRREYSGWVTLANSLTKKVMCNPGPEEDPCSGKSNSTGSYYDLQSGDNTELAGFFATFHSHSSATCPEKNIEILQEPTRGVNEKNVTNPTSLLKASYVLMMRAKTVYLFNKNDDQGSISFDQFKNLGK